MAAGAGPIAHGNYGANWRRLAAVGVLALALLPGAAQKAWARGARARLFGIVLPRDARPGDRISASVVSNPDDYKGVPALRVIPVEVGTESALGGLAVDLGDGRKQPAEGPITYLLPRDANRIAMSLERKGQAVARREVPLSAAIAPRPSPEAFTMPSACALDRVLAIRGPFGGDSARTSIEVAERPAWVLAETPRAAYFDLPDGVSPGNARVKLREGGYALSFEVQLVAIQLQAGKLALHAGEDTDFTAQVIGIKPRAARWPAGVPSDLFNLASSPVSAPGPREPGKLVLEIENRSPEVVAMAGATGEAIVKDLYPDDFSGGSYVYHGHLHANQAGTFNLSAQVIPFVGDQAGTPETIASPASEKTPEAERTPHGERTPEAHRAEQAPSEEETPVANRDLGPPVEWVPNIPVAAPPKCCVITSLTVTNDQPYAVFFEINGRYHGVPPPEEWVPPGKSVTFNGDLGQCVRIEAFNSRSFDEEGNPISWLFDDETICCKDLVSGKKKSKRFSYTINSIGWREWKDCPDTPPKIGTPPKQVIRRTRTPTPTRTRTRTPTPTATQTATATPTATPFARRAACRGIAGAGSSAAGSGRLSAARHGMRGAGDRPVQG